MEQNVKVVDKSKKNVKMLKMLAKLENSYIAKGKNIEKEINLKARFMIEF